MNEIMAIASGTWQRILRMRVVYFLVACVCVLIWSAYRYEVLSMGMHKELMVDVSLVLNMIAAIVVAISITFEIPKELREGVASTLLSKPLGRTQYLLGKLVGTVVTGVVVTGLITIGFAVIFNMAFGQVGAAALQGHLLIMASVVPMAALGVFYSVFIPESVAAVITALTIWFTHSTGGLAKVKVLYGGVIPDFNLFNLRAEAAYGIGGANWTYLVLALAWGVVFSVFITTVASLIFSHKDLK